MRYYDEDFKPFEIVDGQCVVADEAEWGELRLNCAGVKIANCLIDNPPSYVVKIPTDIFEDVEGPLVDTNGKELFTCHSVCSFSSAFDSDCTCGVIKANRLKRHAEVLDVLARMFRTVDATPHVDYLLMTQHPERVRERWQRLTTGSGHNPSPHEFHRANVIIAVPVETQADIERLVPELLKCHDLCKGLAVVCNPKEELSLTCQGFIDADEYGPERIGYMVGKDDGKSVLQVTRAEALRKSPLNLIIAEGNDHPMHPDHVRSLRDQCLDANVEFNFASWGRWLPEDQQVMFAGKVLRFKPEGKLHAFSPVNFSSGNYSRLVGKERSGRLLDGQEHNGRVQ